VLTDPLGRKISLDAPPRRIVSLVPSLTDYLFAIGAGARVVGATTFCAEPAAQLAGLPRVGGPKTPDTDAIIALQPDLVVAAKEENQQHDVAVLEGAGLPVYVTDICSVVGALEQLTTLAEAVGALPHALPLLNEMSAELREALEQQRARERAGRSARRVLAFIWRDPWMAVGGNTYADDMLRLCGGKNLALNLPGRYPRAALETFLELDPEIILLPDDPYHFGKADQQSFAAHRGVTAVQEGQVYLCNGKSLTWYGRRTAEALRTFRALLA
jgi:ABC-type Fe3+-hydroxamate transport system substrate-binding protein